MLLQLLGCLGGKIIDKLIDGSLDAAIDKASKERILSEYKKVNEEIRKNLLEDNKDESYFESLQRLIEDSRLVENIFSMCYAFSYESTMERKKYITEYICEYFKADNLSVIDREIIVGKIIQQYEYCYNVLNKPDDETRKIINQIGLQIANQSEEQKLIISDLHCDIKALNILVEELKEKLLVSEIDLLYLHELTKESIDNLNVRFSKDFNVDVRLSEWLDMFTNTEKNKRNLYQGVKKVVDAIRSISIVDNSKLLIKWTNLLSSINRNESIQHDLLEKETEDFMSLVDDTTHSKYKDNQKEYYESNDYHNWRYLCNVNDSLDQHRKAMQSDAMIVTGEAGIGKSHSLAHFVYNEYYQKNEICIFLLGQHINLEDNLNHIIEKQLHVSYTLEQYLEKLNILAEKNNVEIPFIIEGINESLLSERWTEYYTGLVELFSKYNRIKLVISIRSTYLKKCLPQNYNKRESTLVIEHKGFEDNYGNAVARFFDYYGISQPSFPILYQDFFNPLFLHTLCKTIKGSNKTNIEEYSSFTEIFMKYIQIIEEKASKECNYIPGLKIINKIIDSIVKKGVENKDYYGIKLNEFYFIVKQHADPLGINTSSLVKIVIDEGLFYIDINSYRDEEEYVRFSYERYQNILTAHYLLENITSVEKLKEEIQIGSLKEVFSGYGTGIGEELFIMIPEKYNIEVLDLIEEKIPSQNLDFFLNSLIWRNKKTINSETFKLINDKLLTRQFYFERFIRTMMIIAPIENHPLNAIRLHKYLIQFSMSQRDSFWIKILYDDTNYEGVLNNLLMLVKNQKNMYSKETKFLISTLISWTFASTNNMYREDAIRTLAFLLTDSIDVACELVENFATVDDGYIKEGLYCSIYGAVMCSSTLKDSYMLVCNILDDVFKIDSVYPNIIVRAHAKGIIDYYQYKGAELPSDKERKNPPYKSTWYDEIPTNDDIKKYEFDYKTHVSSEQYCVNKIISSMATNTGNFPQGYGDFGRYIFEGWVEPWDYHFVPQELSNLVVKIIMEQYQYNYKTHGKFDCIVQEYNRHEHKQERIGKKYQRIASFEMLAKLSDNFEPGIVETVYSEEYSNWNHNRLERFLNMYKMDNQECSNSFDELDDMEEEKFIQEDHIKEIFKPYKYEGPWQFNYRGIDPSCWIIKKTEDKENCYINFTWNEIENWASNKSLSVKKEAMLFLEYSGKQFIVLDTCSSWEKERKDFEMKPQKYVFIATAMMTTNQKEINKENVAEIGMEIHDSGNPQSYNIFAREYYWSDAYKNHEEIVRRECDEDKKREFVATVFQYMCPQSYSEQVDNVVSSYMMPSKELVDALQLEQRKDGMWFDLSGNLAAIDLEVLGYQSMILIDAEKMKQYLSEHDMKLVWNIYTEKEDRPNMYSTREVAIWDGVEFIKEQYEEESWKTRE